MERACYCADLRAATRRLGAIYDEALAPFGINIAQFSLMRTIARNQPVSLTELGRIRELDRSTVGRNVRVLERMALVETEHGGSDLREAAVSLTRQGARLVKDAALVWDQCQSKIEGRLGAKRVNALRDILNLL